MVHPPGGMATAVAAGNLYFHLEFKLLGGIVRRWTISFPPPQTDVGENTGDIQQ